MNCLCCSYSPCDPSHIKTNGSAGNEVWWNLLPLCRNHHVEWGKIGISKFLDKYPAFERAFKKLGWSFENNKLWNPRLSPDYQENCNWIKSEISLLYCAIV